MKRKRASALLVVILIYVSVMLGRYFVQSQKLREVSPPSIDTVLGIHIVEDTDFLNTKTRKSEDKNSLITFENVLLPYDSSGNTVYMSQSLDGWTGRLSIDSKEPYCLCAPKDEYWYKQQDAIKEGHVFTLWAVGKEDYYEFDLIISGMPVISINTERMEEAEPVEYEVDPDKLYFGSETLHYGTIDIFDPDVASDKYEIIRSKVCYHVKGATAKIFSKKSYSFKLQNHKEENIDAALLGMRSDNSWKLNALCTDSSKIREITAAQIWESMEKTNTNINAAGPKLKYAELVLDDVYQGLYCLVEPVDEKKLNLTKNDILYKCIDWNLPDDENIQESIDNKWKIQYPFRIRYPKVNIDYNQSWTPIRDYINIFYRNPEIEYDRATRAIELDNLIDYTFFVMTCTANDNFYKNIYYAARRQEDGSYKLTLIPWDLDYSFGNIYKYGMKNSVMFDDDHTVKYTEMALQRMLEFSPEEIGAAMSDKWKAYRSGVLSTESILQLLEDNNRYIIDTGAIARESDRWPEYDANEDIDELIEFQIKRMDWLDEYYEGGIQ